MKTFSRVSIVLALFALTMTIVPSVAAVTYATVDGYAAGTPANNNPDTWESTGVTCTKVEDPGGSSYTLDVDAVKVIVKAGSEESNAGFVNTIFNDVSSGETVWADTNGDGTYNPGGKDGDKDISHVIICVSSATPTPESTPTPEATPTPDVTPTPEVTPTPDDQTDTGGGTPPRTVSTVPPTDTATEPLSADAGVNPLVFLGLALIGIAAVGMGLEARRNRK